MKEGHYCQDDADMLTARYGVQLSDDERLVWLAAFGAAAVATQPSRERCFVCREKADTAVDLLREARATHKRRAVQEDVNSPA